jgi:hypothetical protein
MLFSEKEITTWTQIYTKKGRVLEKECEETNKTFCLNLTDKLVQNNNNNVLEHCLPVCEMNETREVGIREILLL